MAAEADEVEGTVIGFSDSGMEARVYAVIEVVRRQEVVVPIARLRIAGSNPDDGNVSLDD
jgi:hypothetical protein